MMLQRFDDRCRHCGSRLDGHAAIFRSGVCNRAACRAELAREQAAETAKRHWTETLRRSREQIHDAAADVVSAARTLNVAIDDLTPVAVPLLERPMVALGPGNHALMVQHVTEIVAQSFSAGPPDPVTPDRDRLEAPAPEYEDAACATCKGACCAVGRDYLAFLTADTITQYRRHVPGLSPDQVRDNYLDLLPDRIVDGSCYFHGAQGCTLAREQRDNVCHRHLCQQLHVQNQSGLSARDGPFVILAADQDGNRAVTLYAPPDMQRLEPETQAVAPDLAARITRQAMAPLPPTPPAQKKQATPRRQTCGWCRKPITPAQAALSGCCGLPACETARRHDMASERAAMAT